MIETILSSLVGLGAFAAYFASSIGLLLVFKFVYTFLTPHDEWELIKEKQNTSAGIALGGTIIGFAIALSGAASNSQDFIDFLIWAIVAMFAQLLAYCLVRFAFMPKIVSRIEKDEVSAAITLASFSIAFGLLNAACMSY